MWPDNVLKEKKGRPVNCKSRLNKSEMENVVIVSSAQLLIMVNENKLMKFPYDAKILRDPNVRIGDTSATCDVDFKKSGMTNTGPPKDSSVVVA